MSNEIQGYFTNLEALLQLQRALVEEDLMSRGGFVPADLASLDQLLARGQRDVMLPPGLLSAAALQFLNATPVAFEADPILAADARARQVQSVIAGEMILAQQRLLEAFVVQSMLLQQQYASYARALPVQAGVQPQNFNSNDLQGLLALVMMLIAQASARRSGNGDLRPRAAYGWPGHPGGSNMDRGRIEQEYTRLPNGGNVGDVSVDRLFRAIVGQETGGKNVVNSIGATGIGQVMPANIGPWSREALGRTVSYQEFKSRPDLQAKIIQFKLQQYLREAHSKGLGGREAVRYVAAAWYSGQGRLKDSTRPQNGGPSIARYADSVAAQYGGGTRSA